jgi:hypothetical protein
MKKTLVVLSSISVFLGAGYAAWAYTPLGKKTLSKWLLKKWGEMAKRDGKKLDLKVLENELVKLSYRDHELLFRYTRNDFMGKAQKNKLDLKTDKKLRDYLKKMKEVKIMDRANLSSLENIVLPG